jgi:hypothetical protein
MTTTSNQPQPQLRRVQGRITDMTTRTIPRGNQAMLSLTTTTGEVIQVFLATTPFRACQELLTPGTVIDVRGCAGTHQGRPLLNAHHITSATPHP